MNAAPRLLDVRGVVKTYGQTTALTGVDLAVRPGEIVGLLGPNGAGKSTLIRIICGLLRADAGTVEHAAPPHRGVGYCPQRLVVWPDLTCREQLEYVATLYSLDDPASATARELRRLSIEERADDLAETLSGGMRRRLSIALALVHDPALVVLDEAEVGLDPQSRVALRRMLRELADRGKGVLLSTHAIAEVEALADRVVILDGGEVIADAAPGELTRAEDSLAIVELELPESPSTDRLIQALTESFGEPTRVDGRILLRTTDTLDSVEAVIGCIRAHGLEPRRLGVRRPGLEDVFVELTGRRYQP